MIISHRTEKSHVQNVGRLIYSSCLVEIDDPQDRSAIWQNASLSSDISIGRKHALAQLESQTGYFFVTTICPEMSDDHAVNTDLTTVIWKMKGMVLKPFYVMFERYAGEPNIPVGRGPDLFMGISISDQIDVQIRKDRRNCLESSMDDTVKLHITDSKTRTSVGIEILDISGDVVRSSEDLQITDFVIFNTIPI